MIRTLALAVLLTTPALAADRIADAARVRDAALAHNDSFAILTSLTTEVGPRLAGSAAEARARDWGVRAMKAAGLTGVHIETFPIKGWERGVETAEVVGASPQRLLVTALGRSGATPAGGVTAPIVYFADLQALKDAAPETLKGKIAFIDHHMAPAQDGGGYGANNAVRSQGPAIAAGKGAVATLIRSLGTGTMRDPHTGVTQTPDGQQPSPAGALSVPDAEQLVRLLRRGPVSVHLTLTPRFTGTAQSGSVVGDLPGSGAPNEYVIIGGHLDSWDLGTGAIDDGAGVAITLAAAKAIKDAGLKPRRTIRVVFWGSEEVGGEGGAAFAAAHKTDNVQLAAESDFGADRVYRFATSIPAAAAPLTAEMARVLAPLGVDFAKAETAHGGADAGPVGANGAALIDLAQDGTRYFDLHHTVDGHARQGRRRADDPERRRLGCRDLAGGQ